MPDRYLTELRERGYLVFEGFLGADELAAAQEALWLHFPIAEGGGGVARLQQGPFRMGEMPSNAVAESRHQRGKLARLADTFSAGEPRVDLGGFGGAEVCVAGQSLAPVAICPAVMTGDVVGVGKTVVCTRLLVDVADLAS